MSEEARTLRRLEIESDLWEHFSDRAAEGVSPALVSVETFSRMLRGVPSDIAWRFQAEGFHMNIKFPVERIAGVLLLFLLIPFIAGSAISGYDTGREAWPGEFQRFSDMKSSERQWTAVFHALVGLGLVAAASQLMASFRERSPRLITAGGLLLVAAGTIMLANAAVYRGMSAVADDYLASRDASLVSTARAFATVTETLAWANLATSALGILCLGVALVHLHMLPRWTIVLPAFGVTSPLLAMSSSAVSDGLEWIAIIAGMLCVTLWLLICGVWLLFGGSRIQSMKGLPAQTG